MKKKFLIILVFCLLTETFVFGQFEAGTSFINSSFWYSKKKDDSKDFGLSSNSHRFGINVGYNYFFKKNQAVLFGLGYLNTKNTIKYNVSEGTATQKSNGFEGILSYVFYNKKKNNFFIGHQFSVTHSFEKSRGFSRFTNTGSMFNIDSELRNFSFVVSPLVLNYQVNERFLISSSSFLTFSALFNNYTEKNINTNQIVSIKKTDYSVSFFSTVGSISFFYLIGQNKKN
jgi:hypothetical protein